MKKSTRRHSLGAPLAKAKHVLILPRIYRELALKVAHNSPMGGHLGLRKTMVKLSKYFFWPRMRETVVEHLRSCRVCQTIGKPAHTPPPAPLCPITSDGEPFSRLIIDCVGPLPRTKAGNQFLFTIMDSATRYPEAIP